MIVYPAIDVRERRVVRLLYGDPNVESVYSDDPVAVARQWQDAGADWVHVINLDGALGENESGFDTLHEIAGTGLSVQFGGGIRSLDAVQRAIDAGARRVILGTLVVNEPALARQAVERYGADALIVALDAKDDHVATHGWQEVSSWTPAQLGKQFAAMGVRHALYTDISKDGALTGINVEATAALALETKLEVVASGGIATLDDIYALRRTGCVAGLVIGRALYAGMFTLEDALQAARE
ncbi:MAG: 1-(5-phosphoribosyl)-5-[(5-phosphoribosylamino)methylideneamino]imidazole-4-carboxamide isomerase [Chloroflexi bacterium]|nr:1-(5-phosphoribosyl)-5-[(5-phosphoribosylamino)methylideneamino]imidazole-4-carboxamide isomerase [Chloroflexota bacterium]